MKPRELVNHIRSGPADLVLHEPLSFRRRTLFNWCDFSDFIHALKSSKTIRAVECWDHRQLGIPEDEWVLLIKTLGSIKGIQSLEFYCISGSHDFHPFQAVADAVNNALSLRELNITVGIFPSDQSGMIALANTLREHAALREFTWAECPSRQEAAHITAFDPVLRALTACPHLRVLTIMTTCASAYVMENLLQLHSATEVCFVTNIKHWSVMADEIRQGRCNVKRLNLAMLRGGVSDTTEVVKAVASAIRMDQNLELISLRTENGFTDEAGVALAEALTVNTTLRNIILAHLPLSTDNPLPNTYAFGTPAYEAFGAMLRRNTSLNLVLPPFSCTDGDQRLLESCTQVAIEQRLNQVGRGRLLASSGHNTREEWVDALHKLSTYDAIDSPSFDVSCLYTLLRLHPAVCMSRVDDSKETFWGIFVVLQKFWNTGLIGAIVTAIVADIAWQLASALLLAELKKR
jgi:hypothetical protein